MAGRSPFEKAHYQKVKLTKTTAKRIEKIYAEVAKDLDKRLRNLQMLNPSDALKKLYLQKFILEANAAYEEAAAMTRALCIGSAEEAGMLAVAAGNQFMKKAGLSIEGAFAYVPKQEVRNILSGKLYGNKWNLSSAIWKNTSKTKLDIEKVVARGLAENKPIKDIADALTKYVRPSARKPWDWSKVYPGTAAKVDYNAQRLARTMIQHSYQMSMVQSQVYNPFCNGIIWYSAGIHGRTCAVCMERDGNVYPVKDLPLDHPNGLCWFEPAMDDMNAVADRLADYANGKADPEIDLYISKAINSN